jgi:hypothetical protein
MIKEVTRQERNDVSRNDCGAPWNEGDDGECECSTCCYRRREAAREDKMIDEAEYKRDCEREGRA